MAGGRCPSQKCFVEIPVVGRWTVDCGAGCRVLASLLLATTAALPWLYFSLDGRGLPLVGAILGWWWLQVKARQTVDALDLRLPEVRGRLWAVLAAAIAAGALLGRGAAGLVPLLTTAPSPLLPRDAPLLGAALGAFLVLGLPYLAALWSAGGASANPDRP